MEHHSFLETNADGLVRRHESSVVEYKANFSFGSLAKYAKTMAAFANNRGGTIVFGVTNSPRRAVGMTNDRFEAIDSAKLSGELNKWFAPEIVWRRDEIESSGRRFGFLIVDESNFKPVVALMNFGNGVIEDGAVYYRYNARNERIRYGELRKILEGIRKAEQDHWMEHIRRIARIGASQAAVLNPADGLVEGPRGSFVIEKDLLPSISFIRDGDLRPTGGAPVLTLAGRAEVVSGESGEGLIGIAERAISENDIIANFLSEIQVHSPVEYLKAVVSASTKYLPIYYYSSLAKIPPSGLAEFIRTVHGYTWYLQRLDSDSTNLPTKLRSTGSPAARAKRGLRDAVLAGNYQLPTGKRELCHLFEVLRSVDDYQLIQGVLVRAYRLHLREIGVLGEFRKAACYLDWLRYAKG